MRRISLLSGRVLELDGPDAKPVSDREVIGALQVELATVETKLAERDRGLAECAARLTAAESALAAERAKPVPAAQHLPAPEVVVHPPQVVVHGPANAGFDVVVTKRDGDDRIERLSIIPRVK